MTDQRRGKREQHVPVFLDEILSFLARPGVILVDGTLGDGGHSKAILDASGPNARILALDLDSESIERARRNLTDYKQQVVIVKETFGHLKQAIEKENYPKPNGILFDLGMSTNHLQVERGFSFQNVGPLDMRFDATGTIALPEPEMPALKKIAARYGSYKASDILNHLYENEIADILTQFGEERFADRIAQGIVRERKNSPIENVQDLVRIIVRSYPATARHGRIHVATRTFQALRIAVNREYETLQMGIEQSLEVLAPGGRLAIISFHSGEDRIVKKAFRAISSTGEFILLNKHALKPSFAETQANAWSRSARLRVIERGDKK